MTLTQATLAAVKELAHLFRAQRDDRPVFLLGAGASYRSGIPLASDAVRHIARWSYARKELLADLKSSNPRPSDWGPYLQRQPWFIADEDRFFENFPLAVRHLLTPREVRREFLLDIIQPTNGLSKGYHSLAALIMRGLCRTVLTTNFDHLIADALTELAPHIGRICEINQSADDIVQFEVTRRNQVVYLHGSAELYTDKILDEEVRGLNSRLAALLQPLLAASPLIVIGYRGAEHSVMDFLRATASTHGLRHGVYWCTLPHENLHPNVLNLREAIGSDFTHLTVDGFDELLEELNATVESEDIYSSAHTLVGRTRTNSADEETLNDLTLNDLDRGTVLSTLVRYAERLRRAPVTGDNYTRLLEELGLTVKIDGLDRPTIGCYLLFGNDIANRFPHASVAVTRGGKQQQVIQGNLIAQFTALLDCLDSPDVNPIIRIKQNTSSKEGRAYPTRALVELIVNMLVHRDYEVENYSTVDIISGESVTFRNYGGIMPKIRRRLTFEDDGTFAPVRHVTAIRNPSLADIFFGLGPMDKAGTGLVNVQDIMHGNSGSARFAVDEDNHRFVATLLQPLQSAPTRSQVATSRPPMGLYVTNLLPFAVIPNVVWHAETTPPDRPQSTLKQTEDSRLLPIFIAPRGHIYSFANLNDLPGFLEPREVFAEADAVPIDDFISDPDRRRWFVWLLRKHWEFYIMRLRASGLRVIAKEHRAFFELISGDRNSITYNSAKRRGVRRDVVKRRGTDRTVWHENEGIAYSIVQFDGTWAVQVKPFYMFTGLDGKTPLPAYQRTSRSVRRMRFDRNKSVDDDLTFWARFISGGLPALDLGGRGVDDLILSASYETFEVPDPERGVADARTDQLPA